MHFPTHSSFNGVLRSPEERRKILGRVELFAKFTDELRRKWKLLSYVIFFSAPFLSNPDLRFLRLSKKRDTLEIRARLPLSRENRGQLGSPWAAYLNQNSRKAAAFVSETTTTYDTRFDQQDEWMEANI